MPKELTITNALKIWVLRLNLYKTFYLLRVLYFQTRIFIKTVYS